MVIARRRSTQPDIHCDAEFQNLRAVGAFLVSAKLKDGKTEQIHILSEAGKELKMILPWSGGTTVVSSNGTQTISEKTLKMPTKKGETVIIHPEY